MCRLFGFRSIINSKVHRSLLTADNALSTFSQAHPDGWGVAYYVDGSPHVIKSEKTALEDNLFKTVSGVVSSHTVLAHIRNATRGRLNILNTHPFQHGRWVFAHNGNIKNFDKVKIEILKYVHEDLKRYILGETDSEVIFYMLLSHLKKLSSLQESCDIDTIFKASTQTIKVLKNIIGDLHDNDKGPTSENYLTFIITNGETMLGYQGGKKLCFSTHKNICSEKDTCSHYEHECENPSASGRVNHLQISSEPLLGENIWQALSFGQMVAIDKTMTLKFSD